MKNSRATLHHSYEALKDTVHYNYMLQYLAETYKLDQDYCQICGYTEGMDSRALPSSRSSFLVW